MVARPQWSLMHLAAIPLAVACAQAQEGQPAIQANPAGQDSGVAPPSLGLDGQIVPDPSIWFQGDWLWSMRGGAWSSTRDIIGGPDATSLRDLRGFNDDSGYRLTGGAHVFNCIFEGIFSYWGNWAASSVVNLRGVAFNGGINGDWLGRDFINSGTYFAPLNSAANLTVPVHTSNDQSGLGPSTSFPNDTLPVLSAFYHSDFAMTEANVKGADFVLATFGGGLRLGAGFVHANMDELSQVVVTGTFRAVSNVGGPTLSLPDSALTATNGGNLKLYSGTAEGFNDGVTDGSGIPSQLILYNQTNTFNQLNGGQLVLDGSLLKFRRLEVGVKFQAGAYDNYARGVIYETYAETNKGLAEYGRYLTANRNQLAFLGGAGIDIGYHLNNYVSIHGGYELVYLSGLALAQEQVNGIGAGGYYQVQTGGSALIEAAHLGLEIAF